MTPLIQRGQKKGWNSKLLYNGTSEFWFSGMKLNETYNRVSIVIVCNLYFVVTYVALGCSVETDKSDIRSPRSPEGTRGNLMPAPVFLFTNQLLFPLPYLSLPTSFFFPLHHFACWRISFYRPPSVSPLFLILSRFRRGEFIPCRLKESMKMNFFDTFALFPILESSPSRSFWKTSQRDLRNWYHAVD